MRVYVPSTLPGLAEAHKAGELGPGPLTAYAVTPGLREWYVSDDIEGLEYAALNRAAAASLRLLAGDPGSAVCRRVVVAVDVPDRTRWPTPTAALGLRVRWVRCGLLPRCRCRRRRRCISTPMTQKPDVASAAAALGAADHGDDDAQFIVDGAEDHELLWFAGQEIPHLIG